MGSGFEHDCAEDCHPLTAEPEVQRCIHRLYTPGGFPTDLPNLGDPDQRTEAAREWDMVDPGSLRFHEHGTTSFILAGHTSLRHGRRTSFALKCIVYPYLRIPTIARATVRYQRTFGAETGELRHLVRVWASSDSWILMDLIDGVPLDVHVERRLEEDGGTGLRLDVLEELGEQLFAALTELEGRGLHHGDLSTSNVLVQHHGEKAVFRLIDLGSNYLHTQAIPGRAGPGARYVAPELRAGRADAHRADLYSLGQLLVTFAGVPNSSDGTTPDDFYSEAPLLARFIEDLIDHDPARRLLVFEPKAGRPLYAQLRSFFVGELTAVRTIRKESLVSSHAPWYVHVRELFRPLSGAPAEQRRLWQHRREGRHLRWLRWWATISGYAFFVAASLIVMWWMRDLGWNWATKAIEAVQKTAGSNKDSIPFLDDIRAADYKIPDAWGSLPARLVCLSFIFAGSKYYQNLFAGLTPLITGIVDRQLRRQALAAEWALRSMTLVPAVLTLAPTLIQRTWWPICTALGITATFICNLLVSRFAASALRRAISAGLTTVPRDPSDLARPGVAGVTALRGWAGTAAFYGVSCWTIGLLIYTGKLQDELVYAIAVSAINLVLFYVFRCGVNASYMRAGLVRACLAAERLAKLERWPAPAPRQRSATPAATPVPS
ncbi:hypothetical protein AB0M43_01750 [Longispora sp. NPDC051575]|uniref:protein kinase domain-containing protein n=1 Tax=Longispora sp. NPDC051575 TaxID=3154943 RepID=UPI0034330103